MTEIAQLFESALRQNRANLLRKAALNTVSRMPATMTLRELLQSEAGAAIRELTLRELSEALDGVAPAGGRAAENDLADETAPASDESREVRAYRQILEAIEEGPLTIGQLAKQVDIDVEELRGYLNWMKKMGKIGSSGRARATRYFVT
ncbi:MAG: ArsR family transcriptional regulator [Nannocystis sp.]|nr:ArsR family transcriptional regulator [Nannocystis sp.]